MNGLFKTLIAGWGAKKLGGGCLGTIIVFIIIYYLLGYLQKIQPYKIKNGSLIIQEQFQFKNIYFFINSLMYFTGALP